MTVKHLKGSSRISFKVNGKLRGYMITERVKNNKKVIIITLTISILSLIVGIFIPYTLIVTAVGIIAVIITTFVLPPPRERVIEKTEV